MRIGITEVCVDDQDNARTFYTDVLGLVVKFWDNNKEPIGSTLRRCYTVRARPVPVKVS